MKILVLLLYISTGGMGHGMAHSYSLCCGYLDDSIRLVLYYESRAYIHIHTKYIQIGASVFRCVLFWYSSSSIPLPLPKCIIFTLES